MYCAPSDVDFSAMAFDFFIHKICPNFESEHPINVVLCFHISQDIDSLAWWLIVTM